MFYKLPKKITNIINRIPQFQNINTFKGVLNCILRIIHN